MFRSVASEYDKMDQASWIINSYIIGLIVAQPMYGKLSDIYGRKGPLLLAYVCYLIGAILAGSGVSFTGVLIGRAIAGVGNSGISVLISTLIVDLVPMQEVAVWRSYVYALNMAGRALGPPIGGLIADRSNWRWAFLYQTPIVLLTIIFVWWKMEIPNAAKKIENYADEDRSSWTKKLKRIDFGGSITLGIANIGLVLFLDEISKDLNLAQNTLAIVSMVIWLVFLVAFAVCEGFIAHEPVLPLRLLIKRNVFAAYMIQFMQTAAQVALYTSMPLYFRVTVGDSTTRVALRLAIVTVGTIVGGLISGFVIKRTGKYKRLIFVSVVMSNISLFAIYIRWQGNTDWAETLYGFPVGLGFGVSLSAAFIGLTFRLEPSQIAIATSGFYLSVNLGSLFGVSISSLIIVSIVKKNLYASLSGFDNATAIIQSVVRNFDEINRLPGKVQLLVQRAYIDSMISVWLFAFICGMLSLLATFLMQETSSKTEGKRRSNRDYRTIASEEDDDI
ncbi:MFS general substrate transporter [Pseudovirgaria hyperparasitica]|uniref:MFS general substrate transporter n=1 Tax=Pseudovirgaria hyperparasitica TaxID=470096 RepID=A0A6A6W883_9PEZI|nr:MFS general substrate transporter [Pseudovirgaria hyperparasitica]KAF2759098.1 MFS general substrate transporter [Pseudovirgaria hyperparasitica]